MRKFDDVDEKETYAKTASRLENIGYLDRDTVWAAFAAVVDHARWMEMSEADVRAAVEKAMVKPLENETLEEATGSPPQKNVTMVVVEEGGPGKIRIVHFELSETMKKAMSFSREAWEALTGRSGK